MLINFYILLGILGLLWLAIGVFGFIFWWVKVHDFTSDDLFPAFISGILGPLSFLINGIFYFQNKGGNNILIKKK